MGGVVSGSGGIRSGEAKVERQWRDKKWRGNGAEAKEEAERQ